MKGSFYQFCESKEMLVFAVLENIHSELYRAADRARIETDGLQQIGELYPQVLETLVYGACRELFK